MGGEMTNKNENHYRALKNKILAAMIVAPAIPFLLVVAVGFYYFTASIERETFARMVRIAEDHRQAIEMFLTERRGDLTIIANSFSIAQMNNPEELRNIFDTLRQNSPAYTDLGLFNPEGVQTAYVGPYRLAGKQYKDAPWYKGVLGNGYYISDVFLGYRKSPHFIIAIAIQDGDQIWVLRATIDTVFFSDMVEKVRMGKTGEAYLVNAQGVFQTQRRSGGELLRADPEPIAHSERFEGVRTFAADDKSGDAYLYGATWLSEKDWQLIVRQEKADAFRDLRTAWLLAALILVLGVAGIVSMGFYLTGKIIARLSRIDSEKSQLNQQLIVASRLAEIGEMSAGFAHEINNPLQIIRSEQTLISVILDDMRQAGTLPQTPDTAELLDSVQQIKLQIDRCGNITQSILKFARQKDVTPQELSLSQLTPEIVAMVRKKAQVNGVELAISSDPATPKVQGDASQVQQVLLNLINNAMDAAIARHGASGGRVELRVGVDGEGQARLSVSDNGVGISEENLRRIFTPFFTTKPVGQGTGLGLSVCFGIIDAMGGTIDVASQVGQGSTFTITLPAAA
ncbi:integral membrane sensor signal transduction histidine kinase [Desulfarculus baarsii DSM 2075]|uniref:histidine kinase n=2 Tax=Desulfarculus baarsii TaxID=453230 RepID=E1QKV7_DESB2|nr:integral membrane sensor signal transduction histidine kinase [Desulfarculus baarsii DSM 2075]